MPGGSDFVEHLAVDEAAELECVERRLCLLDRETVQFREHPEQRSLADEHPELGTLVEHRACERGTSG